MADNFNIVTKVSLHYLLLIHTEKYMREGGQNGTKGICVGGQNGTEGKYICVKDRQSASKGK